MSMDNREKTDRKWMQAALDLAGNGEGHVHPNPLVGAVIVKDGEVIGNGWHEYCGGLHAERNALKDCRERGNDPQGATIYVTLEPCCHYGKTPPCTEAIIENRLGRVVFGAWDPNPLVAGKGIQILRDAGIETEGPVMEEECLAKNKIFFHYITRKMPYVIMKYAMTADGKIACVTGDSRWVTGESAREHTHRTRRAVTAIMAGINTVLQDDPMLNCRLEDDPVNPVRIICDSRLRIPLESRIVQTAGEIPTIVAYRRDAADENGDEKQRLAAERAKVLEEAGIELIPVGADSEGHTDLKELMRILGEKKIDSILLEGGGELNYSALRSGIVSCVQAYIAPKIVGGAAAKSPVGGAGIEKMTDCVTLSVPQISTFGPDILLTFDVLSSEAAKETENNGGAGCRSEQE